MPAPRNVIDQLLALMPQESPASAPLVPFDHALDSEFMPDYQQWDFMYWGWYDDANSIWPVGKVIVDTKLVRQIKAPKARGAHGSRVTDSGKMASKVKIEVYLWRRDHFAAFDMTAEKYAALKKIEAGQAAIKIIHPETRRAKIEFVVIKEIEMPVWQAGGVKWAKATLECLEWIPPPKRAASGPTHTLVSLPPSQIDRLGQTNRSVAPVTPATTEALPASGIPNQTLASGL